MEWISLKLTVEQEMQRYAALDETPYLAKYERLSNAIAVEKQICWITTHFMDAW
jgi:hypothetical protein